MTQNEAASRAIIEYFDERISPDAQKAKAAALSDLYNGPQAHFDEPGEGDDPRMTFGAATRVLHDWWNVVATDFWYDNQSGEALADQPIPHEEETGVFDEDGDPIMELIEPRFEDYVYFEASDAKRIFFGAELAPHV